MGEVVNLKRGGPAAMLEHLLERVRHGEITHIAVAYVKANGAVGHTWTEGRCFGTLLGAIGYMHVAFALAPIHPEEVTGEKP